jgi:hypothetical protein
MIKTLFALIGPLFDGLLVIIYPTIAKRNANVREGVIIIFCTYCYAVWPLEIYSNT